MDPQGRFCHNERCWTYGRTAERHIVIHSRKRAPLPLQTVRPNLLRHRRRRALPGAQAAWADHHRRDLAGLRLPGAQVIVAAFGLDKRTILHRWQHESGRQCQRVHEHILQAGGVLLAQVQAADESRVRVAGGVM